MSRESSEPTHGTAPSDPGPRSSTPEYHDWSEPEATDARMSVDELRELWEASPAYTGVSRGALEDFAEVCQLVSIPGGAKLIEQGQPHGSQYVVVHGRLREVRRDAEGRVVSSFDLRRGDDAGLEFLFSDRESLGDVYAVRDSVLLRLSRSDFERLGHRHPDVLMEVSRAIIEAAYRSIEGFEQQAERVVSVAVVPSSAHPWLAGIASALAEAAGGMGSVVSVSADRLEAALGAEILDSPAPTSHQRLAAWLDGLEESHRMVFYACDPTPTMWNETVLRQADRIMVCVAAGTPQDPERVAMLLAGGRRGIAAQRVDMMFVHDPQTGMPSGTRRWLELGTVTAHHHVRAGQSDDLERIARRLLGRAVGVVMGGGGAKGIAHVGVLQALNEAGIPIDYVGGTSMGSIFAGGWARGWDAATILDKVRDVFKVKNALIDLTLPLVALTVGNKLERVLQGLYEDLLIEDLWIPFFCTSTSLGRPGAFVHQEGSLWKSIRASISLPAIFPPVRYGEDLLVDGGLLDNLPVGTMARLCDGGPVVAVDVGDSMPPNLDPAYGSTASGWGIIRKKLLPFAEKVRPPGIVELIMRCTVVGSQIEVARARRQATLNLKPPVEGFNIMQFDKYEDIYRVSYEYAVEQLEAGGLDKLKAALASEGAQQ